MEYETIKIGIEEDGEISATGVTHDEKCYSMDIDFYGIDMDDDLSIVEQVTQETGCQDVEIDRY